MSLASIFRHPTVKEQADFVLQLQLQQLPGEQLEAIMAELSDLSSISEDEARSPEGGDEED